MAVYKILAPSVPYEEIYSSCKSSNLTWQEFIKTVFCWVADDVFELRFRKTDKKAKEECFDRWRAIPRAPELDKLELGTLLDVRVKNGGPLDQGRRKRLKKLQYTDSHVLMVSGYLPAAAHDTEFVQRV